MIEAPALGTEPPPLPSIVKLVAPVTPISDTDPAPPSKVTPRAGPLGRSTTYAGGPRGSLDPTAAPHGGSAPVGDVTAAAGSLESVGAWIGVPLVWPVEHAPPPAITGTALVGSVPVVAVTPEPPVVVTAGDAPTIGSASPEEIVTVSPELAPIGAELIVVSVGVTAGGATD
ncbi:MAG: hypothetical protein ACXVRK_02465 [Gaiellaceae bacterium]